MPAFSSFVKLALAIVSTCALEAYALNDWSVPCFDGQCSYDLPSGGSGSLQIWGSSNSISDITAAAGWTILTCDSSLASQDIRLVCNNDDPGCQNLFDGAPEGKIIRLPETCSSVAFAIVTSVYVSDDQSLPSNFNIGSSQPQVKGLSFGTSWPSSAPSGNVNFAIQASSIPGQNNTLNATAPSEQRRQHARSWVPPVAVAQRRNFLSDALSLFSSPTFEEDIVNVVIPVEVQETSNILQINAECGSNQFFSSPFEAIVDVNVDAAMSANIEVAVVATGTIIPPQFTDFAVFTDMDATIKSTMRIQSNALGSLQSETIDVFQTSLSGLNFPGILNIEPTFQLQAAANADLDFDLDASVDLAFEIKDAQLVFPPSRGSSGGTFTRTASNVNVSASAVIDSAVKFVGQLTPSVSTLYA
ncbi:hypothetical protein FA95DRAFT_1411663 [Auriscalpium vulgare]|uniref:Uncharacterized protein n=1 Tax=Auriscalpium vulgare TaxID=40419 RepID=A0ACB8R2B8_9AGAM|nr:hypothetical protein FA95DRAFT_1411663 [Auriscalpium vulgare]